jgi:hypothetical protein
MKKVHPIIFIVAVSVFLFVFATEFTVQGSIATLFQGDFRSNQDCTFITNARTNEYGNVGVWISVDRDSNARKEGYGFAGYSNVVCTQNLYASLITRTVEGQDVCVINSYPTKVFITTGTNQSLTFDSTEPEANNAILNCEGTLKNQGTGLNACLFSVGNYCITYVIVILIGIAALLYWLLE